MSTSSIPLAKRSVAPIVAPHLAAISRVLTESWGSFAALRTDRPADMHSVSSSSRGMLVSDFTREPAHRIFKDTPGVKVDDRYGRPWLTLGEDEVSVRFRKLSPSLTLCRSDSGRATALAYHLHDPALPGMEESTILTAGYVLDQAEIGIERLMLVCHFGDEVLYAIALPGGAVSALRTTIQLPTNPLPAPMIRSARAAATKKLAGGAST